MNDPKKLLIKILDCIEYDGDRDEYADFLLGMIFEDSIFEALKKMPAARRKSVAQKFDTNRGNPAALKTLIRHNFSEAELQEGGKIAAEKAITAYLARVTQTATDTQRVKLKSLFDEFGQSL